MLYRIPNAQTPSTIHYGSYVQIIFMNLHCELKSACLLVHFTWNCNQTADTVSKLVSHFPFDTLIIFVMILVIFSVCRRNDCCLIELIAILLHMFKLKYEIKIIWSRIADRQLNRNKKGMINDHHEFIWNMKYDLKLIADDDYCRCAVMYVDEHNEKICHFNK